MRAQEEGRKKKKKNRSPSVLSIFSAPAWRTLESPPSARGRAQLSTAPMAHAHGEKREEKREEGRVLARRRVECKKEKKKVKQVLLAFSLFSLPRFFFFFSGKGHRPSKRVLVLFERQKKKTRHPLRERDGGAFRTRLSAIHEREAGQLRGPSLPFLSSCTPQAAASNSLSSLFLFPCFTSSAPYLQSASFSPLHHLSCGSRSGSAG